MEAARKIRDAVNRVASLRQATAALPAMDAAVRKVKAVQSRRFAGTYADLLASGPYAAPARFFLDELYSDKDYAERDAQFARIAGAIEKFFPPAVSSTAAALAGLHALTEELDHAMALAWVAHSEIEADADHYVVAWRAVGRRSERESQLSVVLDIGMQMARLTRTPGLRTLLKMMRGPAVAAGLGSLQRFLENGFDTFAQMARRPGGVEEFLRTIRLREAALIANLFDAELVACETELAATLGQAP
ncbi:MAG TPA: hypothetical protein VK996_10645 [Ramlibacter sp.]|nr:hypothetical protein [Ramlibacter sp.]